MEILFGKGGDGATLKEQRNINNRCRHCVSTRAVMT